MTTLRAARPSTRLGWSVGLLGAGVLGSYLYAHDPHQPGAYPACVLHALTGLYCPGCGGTRAAYDLVHGLSLIHI